MVSILMCSQHNSDLCGKHFTDWVFPAESCSTMPALPLSSFPFSFSLFPQVWACILIWSFCLLLPLTPKFLSHVHICLPYPPDTITNHQVPQSKMSPSFISLFPKMPAFNWLRFINLSWKKSLQFCDFQSDLPYAWRFHKSFEFKNVYFILMQHHNWAVHHFNDPL